VCFTFHSRFSPLLNFWLSFDIHLKNLVLVIFCYACLHKELASDLLTLFFQAQYTEQQQFLPQHFTLYVRDLYLNSLLEFFYLQIWHAPLFSLSRPHLGPPWFPFYILLLKGMIVWYSMFPFRFRFRLALVNPRQRCALFALQTTHSMQIRWFCLIIFVLVLDQIEATMNDFIQLKMQ